MTEEWREIPGTDYSVSNEGRVMSRKYGREKVMGTPHSGKYPHGHMWVGGVKIAFQVHRLVAEAFIGPPPTPEHQVNHKDGVKSNNSIGNLEWVTCGENHKHRYDVLGDVGPRGERSGQAKLTEAKVRNIRERRARGESVKSLSTEFGVSGASITNTCNGKRWGWLP